MLPTEQNNLWWVYGEAYDLSPFVAQHAGGMLILLARGTDCTELIEQTHPFSIDKIKNIIKPYRVALSDVSTTDQVKSIVTGAYLDFLMNVAKEIEDRGLSYSRLTCNNLYGWVYVTISSILFYFLLTLLLLGVAPWVVAPLLGVAMACHTQYLSHEASHFSLTKNRNLNIGIALYSMAVMSFGRFFNEHWNHHQNTNDYDKDQDFYRLDRFFKLTNLKRKLPKKCYRQQHLVFYLLGPVLSLKVMFGRLLDPFLGYVSLEITQRYKLFYYTVWSASVILMNVAPFVVFGWTAEAVWVALIPRCVQWYIFVNLYQWNHFHDNHAKSLQYYTNHQHKDSKYFEHVLATTHNVSENNPITRYTLVGNQIQHHLLPLVSASWTHVLVNATRKTAQKYNLKYSCAKTVWEQITTNFSFYKKKGRTSITF